MKNFILALLCLCAFGTINAQSNSDASSDFSKKGRILVESGYNLVAGLAGGTGLNILVDDDGNTVTSLGIDGGYFISENFALKFKLGLLSANGSVTNFSVGGKYYIGGRVPIELGIGTLSSGGDSVLLGNFSIGYGIKVAENIFLEPNLGTLLNEEAVNLTTGLKFAMFL